MTASSTRACATVRADGWCSTISATWVMVKTKTRSKKSSRVETRSSPAGSAIERELRLRRPVRRVHAVEEAADGFATVDAGDRLREQRRDRPHREQRPLVGALRDGVGGDDLAHHRVVVQPGQRLAGEQSMGAGDGGGGAVLPREPLQQFDDRATGGDL